MLNAIRKGLVEEEICRVIDVIDALHHSTWSSDELTNLIEAQTKLLEGLKNNGN